MKQNSVTENPTGTKQPLSAMAYAVITLLGLVFALGFTYFYIPSLPTLSFGGFL
jgi:hypothetical protein